MPTGAVPEHIQNVSLWAVGWHPLETVRDDVCSDMSFYPFTPVFDGSGFSKTLGVEMDDSTHP